MGLVNAGEVGWLPEKEAYFKVFFDLNCTHCEGTNVARI